MGQSLDSLAVTVKGRLIETEADQPATGYRLYCRSTKQGPFRIEDTNTDLTGRFEIKGLLAGNVFQMETWNPQDLDREGTRFTIDLTKAKPGDVIELGDVTVKNAKSTAK